MSVSAWGQRQGTVDRVTEPGVDVPRPLGVTIGRQPVHEEHQVVLDRVGRGSLRAVDPTGVEGDVVAQRPQQHAEGTVHVEAVSASATCGDSVHGLLEIDRPSFTEVDPGRLVGNPFELGMVESNERSCRRRLGFDLQPLEIGLDVVVESHSCSLVWRRRSALADQPGRVCVAIVARRNSANGANGRLGGQSRCSIAAVTTE